MFLHLEKPRIKVALVAAIIIFRLLNLNSDAHTIQLNLGSLSSYHQLHCRAWRRVVFRSPLVRSSIAASAATRIRRRGCAWMVGPFPRSRSRSSASAVGVRRLETRDGTQALTRVHQEKIHTARGMPAYIQWRRIPADHN